MTDTKGITVVSLNIKDNEFIGIVLPFLKKAQADVICLQEVLESQIPLFERELNMTGIFVRMFRIGDTQGSAGKPDFEGIALFTREPIVESEWQYHHGDASHLDLYNHRDVGSYCRVLLTATMIVEGEPYRIGTTHFTWTPDGSVSDAQRRDVVRLLEELVKFPDIVFAGDFNAPRGGEIFARIAAQYKDNIPPEITSSLDPKLHYDAPLERMVDGLFSTPKYDVSAVEMVSGVSDHRAIIAHIRKA